MEAIFIDLISCLECLVGSHLVFDNCSFLPRKLRRTYLLSFLLAGLRLPPKPSPR
jgi:hypothetical protein